MAPEDRTVFRLRSRFPLRRALTALAAAACSPCGIPCQDDAPRRLELPDDVAAFYRRARERTPWSLGPEGEVLVQRSPGDPPEPVVGFERPELWSNLGLLGTLGLTFPGPDPVGDLVDPRWFFTRLRGTAPEADALVPEFEGPAPARHLAIRLAGTAGGLTETLESVAAGASDSGTRAAAERALGRRTVAPPEPRPLGETLATVPAPTDVLVKIDQARLPSAARALRGARLAGLIRTERAVGGRLDDRALEGVRLSEAAPLLPYEIVRRFGEMLLVRTTLAVWFTDVGVEGELTLEGRFDATRLQTGLQQLCARELEARPGSVYAGRSESGFRVDVYPDRIVVASPAAARAPRRDLPPEALDAVDAQDFQVTAHRIRDLDPAWTAGRPVPITARLGIPGGSGPSRGGRATLELDLPDEDQARQLRGLGPLALAAIGSGATGSGATGAGAAGSEATGAGAAGAGAAGSTSTGAAQELTELLRRVTWDLDGRTVFVDVPLADLDPVALVVRMAAAAPGGR